MTFTKIKDKIFIFGGYNHKTVSCSQQLFIYKVSENDWLKPISIPV